MKNKISIIAYILFGIMVLVGLVQIAIYGWRSIANKKKAENVAQIAIVWGDEKNNGIQVINDLENSNEPANEEVGANDLKADVPVTIDFDVLKEQNDEVVAWLYCPDTSINYPIVFAGDNDKYLHADLNLNYSNAGTLFVEAKNSGDFSDYNTIIYGHNMKDGSMFKTIIEYVNEDFYEKHPVMYLYAPGKRYKIELLAGCITHATSPIYGSLSYSESTKSVLLDIYKKSTFSSGIVFSDSDKLVTMSTCSYEYDDARYVVIGRLVEW